MESLLYYYRGHVTGVWDGDSITLNLDLGFKFCRKEMKLRLYGINTPEIRGEEREKGIIARDALRKKILGKDVIIQTISDKTCKYGRYLGIIYLEGVNINQWLIDNKYAEEYMC